MNRIVLPSLATLLVGVVLLAPWNVKADEQSSANSNSILQEKVGIGLAIAPVKLDLQGKNVTLVGLGSYYVNAQSLCADCHSCPTYKPGHNPFPPPVGVNGDGQLNPDNYLTGGVNFGPATSRSIVPDANGLPAGLDLKTFISTLHTGTDPDDPTKRLTIMPWPIFRFMTNLDLSAIYEYLRSIPMGTPGTACTGAGQ
jgi:hypothetical protein